MPRQNRVTPTGQIIAIEARGTFMGNRGILHNAQQEMVNQIDEVLHAERLTEAYYIKDRKKRTFTAILNTLPNGTFILWEERPYLVWEGALLPWTPAGYEAPITRPKEAQVTVLTPPSTVAALARGYVPVLHKSAGVQRQHVR